MELGEIDPDLDKVDSEDLVELYGLFGLYGKEHSHSVTIEQLEQEYGDNLRGAIYHLWSDDRLKFSRRDEDRVKLKPDEKGLAGEIANRLYFEHTKVDELLEQGDVPEYLAEPQTSEQFHEPGSKLDQAPSEELYTRIFETLSGGRALKPGEIEQELAVDINFELEPKMRYLETQSVVKRTEDSRYKLLADNIDDRFFGEQMNVKGKLMERQRHGNNPWKP